MRSLLIVFVLLFLVGCAFVTTSPTPFFDASDFAAPISEGLYVTDDGEQVDVQITQNGFQIKVMGRNGKVENYTAGIVPTPFSGFGIMQAISPLHDQTQYLPVWFAGDEFMLIMAPKKSGVDFDSLLIRHGFHKANELWQQGDDFDKIKLIDFYTDIIAAIASDPLWSSDNAHAAYVGEVFRKRNR